MIVMGNEKKFSTIISRRFNKNSIKLKTDHVAVELPLEISFKNDKGESTNITILMRTPGDDLKLAVGFLITEGIIHKNSVSKLNYESSENKIEFIFASDEMPEISDISRNFVSNSSCGICGKNSLDEVLKKIPPVSFTRNSKIEPNQIKIICQKMREKQKLFSKTGGVHGIGLFNKYGEIILVEEDVGRHNALDKAIGSIYLENRYSEILGVCLSGRASYEMVQKAAMAGIQIMISVGAPTSLAIDLAASSSIALIGFVSKNGYNIYTNEAIIFSNIN